VADLTHLATRVAGPADRTDGRVHDHWGGEALPAWVHEWHRAMARAYLDHLRGGETGQAAALLHELKASEPVRIDPWRLVEHVAALALGGQPEDPAAVEDELGDAAGDSPDAPGELPGA
jgi:hypothetical protein